MTLGGNGASGSGHTTSSSTSTVYGVRVPGSSSVTSISA